MNQQVQQDQQVLPEYLIKEKKKLNTSYSSENDLSFSSHIQNALREDTKCSVQLNETTIHDYQKHIQHLNNILSKSANKNDSLRKQIKELNLQINLLQEQSLSQQTTQLMGQAMRIIQVENAALKEELNLYKIKPIETQLIEQIQNYNTPEIERIHLILEQQLRHKGVQTELLKRELILIKQIKQIDQLQKAKAELEQSFYLTSCKLEHKRTKARNNKIENKLLKNYVDHFHLKTSTEIMNIFDSNNNLEVFESNLNHSRIEPQMSLKLQQNKDEVLSQRDSLEDPTQPLKKKLLEQDQILQQFYHKQEQLQNQIESQLELIQNQKQQIEQYDNKHLELEAQIIQLQTTLSEQNESCNQLICDLKAKLEKKQMVQSLNTHQKKQIQNNHMVNSNFESPQKSGLFKKQTSFDYQFTKKSSTSNFGKTERDLSESIDLKYILPPSELSHNKIQSKIGEIRSKLDSLSQSMSKSTQKQGHYLQSKKTSIFIDFNYK